MRLSDRRQNKQRVAAIDHGHKLFAARQEQDAFEFLEEAVQRFPEDPEIRLLYATILLAFRPDDVAAEAAKAVDLGPDDPALLVRAAHLLLWGGQIEAARVCVARAKELAPPDFLFMPELVNREGLLASLDGEDDIAEEKLRSAVDAEPTNASFAIDLAKFLAHRDRRMDALAVIDAALTRADQTGDLEGLRADISGGTLRRQ